MKYGPLPKPCNEFIFGAGCIINMVREERNAAESRIAAALACHTRGKDRSSVTHGFEHCAECGKQWDTEADRCTSPTVAALLGDAG